MKLSVTAKICLSGLFIALTIIFTRVLSLQNIPIIPFVRISLGPACIIFASLLLGPLFGGVVGGASDILGILLFPNALGYSINPWLTVVYTFVGIVPWCIYQIFKRIKNEKILQIIFSVTLGVVWAFVSIYLLTHDTISKVEFNLLMKILFISISLLLCVGMCILTFFIKKKFDKDELKIMSIAYVCLLTEIIMFLGVNTFVKAVLFEMPYAAMFFFQALVLFINVPMNTYFVGYLLKLSKRVFLKNSNEKD